MADEHTVLRSRSSDPFAPREENLALVFQEAFTAVTRMRSSTTAVSDAEVFRAHMRQLLGHADEEARRQGYTQEDIRLATFALVAFLDESALNLRSPVFADWPRRPLQEELFGGHVAGEIFFQSLERLMGRSDSEETADVLEVYQLALLLGYRGRYGIGGQAELKSLIRNIEEKIQRIRKSSSGLSPAWLPQGSMSTVQRDPWIKRLVIVAGCCFVVALLLLIGFKWSLSSGASELETVVAEGRQ